MLAEGDSAPAFEATIQDGSPAALAKWLERGPLVLYFYPKDFTPG
jgi:peroxiredoxin Q/BCP